MPYIAVPVFLSFAAIICVEDLRSHRIRNTYIFWFFNALLFINISLGNVQHQFLAGFLMLSIFTLFYLCGLILFRTASIGFGDVKLTSVIAFGYIQPTFRTFELFFALLWVALLIHFGVLLIKKRKLRTHVPMAPSIFFAAGLYLFTPIGLLLPQ